MDRDGDGQLSKEELIAYQIRLTEHNNKKQTGLIFEKHDEDGNGLISFAEVWVHGEEGVCGHLGPLYSGHCTNLFCMCMSCDCCDPQVMHRKKGQS